MVEKRVRNRDVRWRNVGDTIARNRVARWVIRRANHRAGTRRPRRPVPGWVTWSLAWGVHLYTAMGAVCAALMLVLLVRGGVNAFRGTFALMLVATIIDATDGTLARRIRVKEVLPGFDGRRLDDLVDWLTYTCLPLVLIWRAEILPAGQEAWLLAPLMASAYGFCQTSIKTDDGYFLGFPSLWNVVAFYLYLLDLPGWASVGVILTLSALTFVPSRYLYPSSRPGPINTISNVGAAAWSLLLGWILWSLHGDETPGHRVADDFTRRLVFVSTFYPIWYIAASWAITLRSWVGRRSRLVRSLVEP